MKLIIPIQYEYEFVEWIILQIRNYVLGNIDNEKLQQFQPIIDRQCINIMKHIYTAYEIVCMALESLQVQTYQDRYEISVNLVTKIGITNVSVLSVLKLITYGSAGISAYPIFTMALRHFKNNLSDYYDLYVQNGW